MKKLNKQHMKTRQAGFGALEVMIALIIGSLVIIGAVGWYQSLDTKSKNSDELTNLATLMTNTRQMKTSSGYGTSGTNLVPVLSNAGGIPDTMEYASSVLYNAWGGTVTVLSNGQTFTITYTGLPAENCIFLASKGAASSSQQTRINSGTAITGEVTSIAASSSCNTATNSVAWTVR
jgi:type II secretory pathway pseudopilin PulG